MGYETKLNVEEKVASLFQPDTLMPEQFLDTHRRKTHLAPEIQLMLAVLEDAVACFQKYIFARDGKGREMFREAEEWILAEESDWLFSFDNIADALGLNPRYLREGLMRWKRATLEGRPKAKVYDLAERKNGKDAASEPAASNPQYLKAMGR
jgi:hypothetical protein